MHGNRIASSEMIWTYFVLCDAVRKNIRKMQRDRTKLASADSLLGGRTSREAGHNWAKNSMKSHLKRFYLAIDGADTVLFIRWDVYCIPLSINGRWKKASFLRFAFSYKIELKLHLFDKLSVFTKGFNSIVLEGSGRVAKMANVCTKRVQHA